MRFEELFRVPLCGPVSSEQYESTYSSKLKVIIEVAQFGLASTTKMRATCQVVIKA